MTLRTWYFQSDAKEQRSSPSDLSVLGLSLELLGRWQVDRPWALYASLGPAMAVATLDLERADINHEEDARSLAPGVSAGVGDLHAATSLGRLLGRCRRRSFSSR